MGIGYEIGFIVLLTLANGFFAASEIALLSVRHGRLEQQAAQGSRAAARALELARDPDRFLTTVQIGITLVSTLAAAFGGARLSGELAGALRGIAWVGRHADGIAFALIVASITWLSLVVGELVPKRMALQNAERMARISAPVMWLLAVISRPIGAALIGSVRLVMRVIAPRGGPASRVTPADILDLAREGQRTGSVEEADAALIRKVFAFTDRRVRAAMTPRSEVVSIDVTASFDEVVRAFQTSGFSRLPVVQGALDEVVGVLYLKDILPGGAGPRNFSVRKFLRRATFVYENHPIDRLLGVFRNGESHMAIAVDEYGQVTGVITLEDVLEQLVGEITDEYDERQPRPIVLREDGSWLVDASISYDEAVEALGLPPRPAEERQAYATVAGLLLARMGHIPNAGERLEHGGFVIEVMDLDGRRIDKVMIRRAGGQGERVRAA